MKNVFIGGLIGIAVTVPFWISQGVGRPYAPLLMVGIAFVACCIWQAVVERRRRQKIDATEKLSVAFEKAIGIIAPERGVAGVAGYAAAMAALNKMLEDGLHPTYQNKVVLSKSNYHGCANDHMYLSFENVSVRKWRDPFGQEWLFLFTRFGKYVIPINGANVEVTGALETWEKP